MCDLSGWKTFLETINIGANVYILHRISPLFIFIRFMSHEDFWGQLPLLNREGIFCDQERIVSIDRENCEIIQ